MFNTEIGALLQGIKHLKKNVLLGNLYSIQTAINNNNQKDSDHK